ncbi:MAG: spore germination protein [Firmicutes bacterium]|nr:spore germination protein [Bacillota bacterium]
MFGFFRILKKAVTYSSRGQSKQKQRTADPGQPEQQALSKSLPTNLRQIKEILAGCADVVYREFVIAQKDEIRAVLIYVDGMIDKGQASFQIMKTLMMDISMVEEGERINPHNVLETVVERALTIHQLEQYHNLPDVINGILDGDIALLIDGYATALLCGARAWESRSVEEPTSESVVRGPREGFVETLRTNITQVRRRIKSPDLKVMMLKIGRYTRTDVALMYIRGIADEKLVAEVKSRLQQVQVDGVLESGYLEELIEDRPGSIFAQIKRTERPDKACADLLEGKVAILVDGTPFAMTVPLLFTAELQSAEDYYERYYYGSAIRMVRFLAMVLALTLSSVYIAIVSFHQEMLPTPLLIRVAGQREAVPLPVIMETILMEMVFEILREAGVRLPRQVGQAVSIVGGLVMGDAAVRAGLVAPTTVIVVALSGISSFAIAGYSAAISIRLLRFPMMVAGGTLGLFGVMAVIIAIFIHLASLRSFGVPYLSPVAPLTLRDLKDATNRAPWWAMRTRPRVIGYRNPQRQAPNLKPGRPAEQSQKQKTASASHRYRRQRGE